MIHEVTKNKLMYRNNPFSLNNYAQNTKKLKGLYYITFL